MLQIDSATAMKFAQWIVTGLCAFYVYMARRDAATASEVDALRQRVATLEERVRQMPDHQVVSELIGEVKAMREGMQGIKDSITPLARSVERVNDYLLAQKN